MEQTGVVINIPPPSMQKDEMTVAGEKEGVATAVKMITSIYEEKVGVLTSFHFDFRLISILTLFIFLHQKRKTTTVSIEVRKTQHKYVIGPKRSTIQEILAVTGVSVEVPHPDSDSETITLRGDPDKLGMALTQVYEKANSVVSAEVEAPRWLHRFIIGRKGQNIRKITQDLPKVRMNEPVLGLLCFPLNNSKNIHAIISQVHVEFSGEKDAIVLDGPPEEVERAREALETFIRELVCLVIHRYIKLI